MDIDFVITWVDGSDPAWLKKKAKYKGTDWQEDAARYRDWGILRYWFRAVENYAPWVHRIFFITDNQKPEWLNTNNPKLVVVDHKDYIPAKYLPNFNSSCIEDNIHRIKGLSEHFVYFNDDMFLNQPIDESYYFRNGLPCMGTMEHVFNGRGYYPNVDGWGINIMEYMDTQILNAHFNRKDVTRNNSKGWYGYYLGWKYRLQAFMIKIFGRTEFQHFYTPHNEKAFLKSAFEEVWKAEPEVMDKACTQLREPTSVNCYLMRYWMLAKNEFYPTNELEHKKVIQLHKGCFSELKRILDDNNIKSLCLNDSSNCTKEEYTIMKPLLINLFAKKYTNRSSFEI